MQEVQNFFRRVIQQTRDALKRVWERRFDATDALTRAWQRSAANRASTWQSRSGLSYQALAQYGELVAAVRFLSVLPVPGKVYATQDDETRPDPIIGSGYFSFVGILLAILLALWSLFLGASLHLPSLMIAVLVLIVLVMLTGGLHLDGLMDSCDGLFGGTSREHKLEIMRDSRVGSFAVLGGVCALLFKFVAFATLADLGTYQLPLALLIALPAARWAMVLVVYLFPSARVTGLGPVFRQTVTVRRLVLAAIIALIVALLAGRLLGLLALLGATLVALVVGVLATRILGGLTGDVYGAVEEVSEIAALLVLVLLRSWL